MVGVERVELSFSVYQTLVLNRLTTRRYEYIWCLWLDLNQRPFAYQANHLTTDVHKHIKSMVRFVGLEPTTLTLKG